jgi:uncharacterized protein YacL (UPF0231 family)
LSAGADLFYDARLVEETRLHLAVVLDGRYSEQFFYCFFKLIERKVYLGYYTFKNKKVELKGVIDFIFNKNYGLGLKGIDQFVLAIADVMIYDETESQYARQIIKWLKKQSPLFKLPPKAYEFERLLSWVRFRKQTGKVSNREIRIFIEIYNKYPEYLSDIGEGRKYKTFEQAGIASGIVTKIPGSNIRFNIDMTLDELKDVASKIYKLLGSERNCKLIELLIQIQEEEIYRDNAAKIGKNNALPGDFDAEYSESAAISLCDRIRNGSD